MDTPERSKAGGGGAGGTPLANRFEDSPVFSFINSLSPIQPVKSTVQAYQPLSYAIFTSPHTNPQKAPRPPIRNDSTEASKTDISQKTFEPAEISQQTGLKCSLNEADKSVSFDSSPDLNTAYRNAFKTSFSADVSKTSIQRKSLFSSETMTEKNNNDDVAECDWEYLLSGSTDDLLLCDPETEEENNGGEKLGNGDSFSDTFLMSNSQPNGLEDFDGQRDENQHSGDNNIMSFKVETQQQRGMRRRCLVFDPSVSVPSRGKMVSESPLKPKKQPALPGIGLHLNSLTATSKDMMNGGAVCLQMSQPKLLTIENNMESNNTENFDDESSLAIIPLDAAEPSPSSPKKKRRKGDSGDGEACKRCSCKKSKCLKLYCECFAAGVYCSEPCACQGCFNKPIHEETVLSTRKQIEFRNPLAFAPKVIRTADSLQELIGEDSNSTPASASARHKRGCNCKKSSCLKKYCECFQGGVGCSASCRCETCKNTFGRREDILQMAGEDFALGSEEINGFDEEEKPENFEENATVQNLDNLDQPCLDLVPITPSFETSGTMVNQQCYSSGKPPRPYVISSGLFACNSLLKCKSIANPCNEESESPDLIPNEDSNSNNGVKKTSSPNGKRVTATNNGVTVKGRKLILRSIPSFPSLDNSSNTYSGWNSNNPNSGAFDSSRLTGGM
ncbi:hypothetical protein LUZ60_010228 [Juncus effusus]|nr:hypothetical protein LUZ60_010228 [Juncus effusus]